MRGLVTGSSGATADLNWQLGSHTLTSITAWKSYHFNAVNDDATPFDVYRNAGGFWNDYKQATQELRLTSAPGGFVDYQAGLYFIKVDNTADYRRWWGNDAGAWFATNAQYNRLDADGAGRDLLRNSLANVKTSYNSPTGVQDIRNKSAAIFAQANWHLSPELTLTTGARLTREDRRNTGTSRITSDGSAPELNPASVNGVALGGFASAATAQTINGVNYAIGDLLPGNSAAQIALADATAQKYFNVSTYAALTAAQRRQVADAKAIRQTNIGVLFPTAEAEPFKKTQPAWVLSPSYKFGRDLTGYASLQHGEKAGIAQFVNGVSALVRPEKTDSVELGFKSALLNKTLIFNADIFLTRIKDYQQSVRVVDSYTTALNNDGTFYYTSATGNVPKVEVKGLEIDGVYGGIQNLTVRFSAAYNDAKYKSFPNAAQRTEDNFPGATPYTDLSGKPLAGAAKYTGNVGIDYRQPAWGDKEINYTANVAFSSSYYSDVGLSAYSVVPKSTTVDAGIGFGTRNKSFNVTLLVKNLFDDDTVRSRTSTSYTPALPRSVGIQFMAKL